MERCARMLAIACLIVGLAACGRIGKSAEERITDAMPPGSEVLAAKDKLEALATAQSIDVKAIQDEYASRVQRRASECARGYEPSVFSGTDGIREALTDKDCFATTDVALKNWLAYRRIAILLAAPPLRPIPAGAPAMIMAEDDIRSVDFASQAGIALVHTPKQYQVVDIGSGKTLRKEAINGFIGASVSPNGRVFAINKGEDTDIRESESGEVLATFANVRAYQFFWAGKTGAIFQPTRLPDGSRPSAGSLFLDFASGKESRIPMNTPDVERVLPIPGKPDQVAVLGFNRLGMVQLTQAAAGTEAELKFERVMQTAGWDRDSALTADGRTFFGTAEGIKLVSLAALESRTVTLTPLRITRAVATPDPDQLLVGGFFQNAPGMGTDFYLYSLGQRTLAKVEREQLASTRFVYIPTLKRNAVIDGPKLALLDRIPAAAPVDVNEYLEKRAQELAAMVAARTQSLAAAAEAPQMARARILARMERDGHGAETIAMVKKQHGITDAMLAQARLSPDAPLIPPPPSSTRAPALPPVSSPVATLGKTADVAAVGVYEGGEVGQARGAASNRIGTVQVHVRRTARPLILSLSSYEPVRWVITLQPGARLAAVLSSGYSASEVFGAGDARVYRIGQTYAYKRGGSDYAGLDAEVTRWTGKRIGSFQGQYRGGTFVVGK